LNGLLSERGIGDAVPAAAVGGAAPQAASSSSKPVTTCSDELICDTDELEAAPQTSSSNDANELLLATGAGGAKACEPGDVAAGMLIPLPESERPC